MWCILKICGVSWKTLTLTLWFFDNPYSFETITIQLPRIITFFLGSLFLSALLFLFFVIGRFRWWFVERFQVIFLVVFLDVVPFNFDFQKYALPFSFFAIRKDVVQKCFSNYLLCSSCNKKERLLSSNDFSHQARFYGNFRHYRFVCHFYLYFILHQKVLILLNSVSDRRKSWSCWNLRIGDLPAKKVISNYCYLLVLLYAHRPVRLRCHPIECFWYFISQLCKNSCHC